MSATSDHIPVNRETKKFSTAIKMILAILSPIIITVAAFYIFSTHIQNEERIFANISIEGIEVSGLTRSEAIQALGLPAYEERTANTQAAIIFPDDSKLLLTGNDVNLQHNARDVINEAYSIGRGRGLFLDAVSYLQRLNADEISFMIHYPLNEEMLADIVTDFTNEYNKRLTAAVPEIHEDKIIFTKGAGYVTADVNDIYQLMYNGIYKSFLDRNSVEIVYTLPDIRGFGTDILEVRESIFVQMLSSGYDIETNSATESAIGVNFDTVAAAELVRDIETGKTATFYLDFTHPEYHQEYLAGLLFRDLIGQRTTWAHGNSNRLNNIKLSSEEINGYILLPGEEFSFNRVVGQRTEERGFKPAPSLSQGETITTVGGGICQTSSTIYAALKPSDLLVTEQQRHGKPVPYLPWGWDATVFWNFIDFRFVNNTKYPIRIDITLDDRDVTAQIWGTIIDDFPRAADWND